MFGNPASVPAFGSTSSMFGNPATAPAFGSSFSFGIPATTTTTTSSFSFAPATTSTVGFGQLVPKTVQSTGFGTNALSFGSNTFGTGSSTFGGTSNLGTFGGVGATPSAFGTNAMTGFGTGSSGFGTGTSTVGTGTGTFGGLASGTSGFGTSAFGSGTQFGTGTSTFGGLGTNTFNTGSLGTGFSSNTTIGGLGAGTTFGRFGQATPAQNTLANNTLANIVTAISAPLLYGDDRDAIIAKLNQYQAAWGSGKGYYSNNAPPVEFTPDNPFCRFKAIGYSCLPKTKNEDGLVALILNKTDAEVRVNQQQLVDNLHKMMGNKPNLSVCVEGVKPMPDDKSEVTFFVIERAWNGTTRHITANEFQNFLLQPNIKQQLVSLNVENVIAKVEWSKEMRSTYLESPPSGIDPLLWQQAKLDNPDAEKLIPVPMIGFGELRQRLKFQEQETKLHQGRLDIINGEVSELQRNNSTMAAKILNFKQNLLELGHRVHKVIVKQEIRRKMGFAIQADEELLRVHLEAIQSKLSTPTQFKGRLNELLSQIRMQKQQALARTEERYSLDTNVQYEIKEHLKLQQEGLAHLISIVKEDMDDLALIEQDLQETHGQRKQRV